MENSSRPPADSRKLGFEIAAIPRIPTFTLALFPHLLSRTPKQRECLAEIADQVDRKRLMGRVLAHYNNKAELPSSLPNASDLRWRCLAQDLFEMFRSSDQVDTLLVHQLAQRVDDFVDDVRHD